MQLSQMQCVKLNAKNFNNIECNSHRWRIRYLSKKKFSNFNEFSEIKKFVKIRKKFVKCPSGCGLPTTTEEYDAFHGFMLIKL